MNWKFFIVPFGALVVAVLSVFTAILAVYDYIYYRGIERHYVDSTSPSALKILFVGNSFTLTNDMPYIFTKLASMSNPNQPVKVWMFAIPGANLARHLRRPATVEMLRQKGPWDYVVVQEFSKGPLNNQEGMLSSLIQMKEYIKPYNARMVLYETWSDKNEGVLQEKISSCYEGCAKAVDAKLAPVGDVWQKATRLTELYAEDKHHPSMAGSFLAACVLHNAVFGKTPVPIDAKFAKELGLDPKLASDISILANEEKTAADPQLTLTEPVRK